MPKRQDIEKKKKKSVDTFAGRINAKFLVIINESEHSEDTKDYNKDLSTIQPNKAAYLIQIEQVASIYLRKSGVSV